MPDSSNATVTVSLPGSSTTTVELTDDVKTVADALRAAAETLGTNVDVERVSTVKDGVQVEVTDSVSDGDRIAAAGKVGNGTA
jgi:hypothetical protein